MAVSIYNPRKFVQPGAEYLPGDWSDDTRKEIAAIRCAYPELQEWGDLAIGCAWGDYSQDELDVSWCDWLVGKRHDDFLTYIANRP
jgi:hypothetical protein